jgi:hypothetical protein
MFHMRMLVASLILGASIVGCAAEPPPPTDDTKIDDPTTAPGTTDDGTPGDSPGDSPDRAPEGTPSDGTTTPTTPDDTTNPPTQVTPTAATCTVGGMMCCTAVVSASNALVSNLLALLGIQATLLTEPVGVSCTSVASVAACPRVAACCTSSVASLVALGCNAP